MAQGNLKDENHDGENAPRPPMHTRESPTTTVRLTQSLEEHKRGPSGEGIARTDDKGRVVAGEAPPGGPARIVIQIQPPRGEEGTLEVCRTLVRRLNRDGDNWGDPVFLPDNADKVDCEARGKHGGTLRMQVVRATIERRFYADAAAGHYAQGAQCEFAQLADEIRNAIQHKVDDIPENQRPNLTLVLNALATPAHALEEVVGFFTKQHGAWARGLDFDAIWIACQAPDQVYRLEV